MLLGHGIPVESECPTCFGRKCTCYHPRTQGSFYLLPDNNHPLVFGALPLRRCPTRRCYTPARHRNPPPTHSPSSRPPTPAHRPRRAPANPAPRYPSTITPSSVHLRASTNGYAHSGPGSDSCTSWARRWKWRCMRVAREGGVGGSGAGTGRMRR
ncbi:hypothetical protein B0H13DRAFT_1063756 [Mycena leptocephala]|nr:hypothetical protein B0H13DRAFT_1063756 [Mycena leptocephala]